MTISSQLFSAPPDIAAKIATRKPIYMGYPMEYANVGAGKDRHIDTCLTRMVESETTNGFEHFELIGDLPNFNYAEIDLSTTFLGHRLELPIMISSLTGGGKKSERINRNLAEAAQHIGLAMTVGSQQIMLEYPETRPSFEVRRWAPDILLLADLGLVHLNCGLTVQKCRDAVEAIGADGLVLYLNPMHEVVQRNGILDFTGLLGKLETLCADFPYPIMIKEVGYGFSDVALQRIRTCPIAALDVAGMGGTCWSRIEAESGRMRLSPVLELGVKTAETLEAALRILPRKIEVLASGGIRTGADMAKSLAMGATATGMGLPFLRWSFDSAHRVVAEVERLTEELRLCLWYTGSRTLSELKHKVKNTCAQRI
ncbi:MAG: type 2 isopentenyl-diphosphate Delta-isomerase [Desulfuromonadaceae bacterium]|nr:type 2 isopentenyl-diphosphate Delta-isomerase [Desulfuromonadaceae bacterium]